MARTNRRSDGRDTGRPPVENPRADRLRSGDEIVSALGNAERKATGLPETPSEFAAAGPNPHTVTTKAPPVDAPKAKMARGLGRRPLI